MVKFQNLLATLRESISMGRELWTWVNGTCVLDCGLTELIIGLDMSNIVSLAFLYGKVNSILNSSKVKLSPIKNFGWRSVET